MKELSAVRPQVIVMLGLPGAGKSFFANRFAVTFGAPLVSFDQLRATVFPQSGYASAELIIINQICNYQISQLLRSRGSFIVDGGFLSKIERLNLVRQAQKAGYGVLIVWVQTPEGLAMFRSTNRQLGQENDRYNLSLSQSQFETFARRLTSPLRENFVAISGLQTYSAQAKAVLKKLSAPRAAAATTAHQVERRTALQRTARPPSSRKIAIIS